jgi:dihydroorotate dehydrogenase electron transfer subunit
MLRSVATFCGERGLPAQIAVDERMACGLGLCLTCVVPVARKDGRGYDNLRACAEGPVFNPGRVLWDRWGAGAPQMTPTPPEGFPVVRSWPG